MQQHPSCAVAVLKWQVKLIWRKTEKTLSAMRTNKRISFGLKNNRSPCYKLCYLLSCVLLIKLLKALCKRFHLSNDGWLIPHNLFLDGAFTQHLRLLSDQTQNSFSSSTSWTQKPWKNFDSHVFWMNCRIQRCHWMQLQQDQWFLFSLQSSVTWKCSSFSWN